MDEDEDDESAVDMEDFAQTNVNIEFPEHPLDLMNDDIYEEEIGWWIVVMLRGKSTGRKLKRDIFKAGMYQLVLGFVMLIITGFLNNNYSATSYFAASNLGAPLISLLFLVSFPSFLSGILMMLFVKFWATLVTNRAILLNLMRGTMVIMTMLLISTAWCIGCMIVAFKGVRFLSTAQLRGMFPAYIVLNMCIYPYCLSLLIYLLDIHYLTEEVELDGEIREPNGTKNAHDISRFNMIQLFAFTIASPLLILLQIYELIVTVIRIIISQILRMYALGIFNCGSMSKRAEERQKKKRGTLGRLYRTLRRLCKETWDSFNAKPDAVAPAPEMSVELKKLKEQQDMEDDIERGKLRERLELEVEKQKVDKQDQEQQKIKDAEDKAHREAEEARAALERSPTMSVALYKTLWAELAIAGSFQCKLKSGPTLTELTEHFKKQGFHVVFAASPNSIDCELGISNIRDNTGTQKWFMARFLASATSFSAVMKSQDPDLVTGFVKKFALAKALKIDSAASGLKK